MPSFQKEGLRACTMTTWKTSRQVMPLGKYLHTLEALTEYGGVLAVNKRSRGFCCACSSMPQKQRPVNESRS